MQPFDSSIGRCFEETAALYPDRVAMRCAGDRITYRELNARANRIAKIVQECGADHAGRAALLFDQGIEAVAAILAAAKAGYAYVPLDAADPEARMKMILEDCEPLVILTDRHHLSLARRLSPERLAIVATDDIPAGAAPANPAITVPPNQLAYVLYTSGSTGKPKGVCQTHRNLLHCARSFSTILHIASHDRISWLFSLSFAASLKDIFGALLNGATLCAYNVRTLGIAGLAEWVEREQVTVLHMVPSLYRHLATHMPPARRFSPLRAVILGGEAVYPNDVALHKKHFPGHCLLINLFAVTETSVLARNPLAMHRDCEKGILPVGQAAAGIDFRIARQDGTPAEPGEAGEIVVFSEFLSPGYWKRPDLTTAAFGIDEETGRRFYRTGDLGRLDAEGELFFLGRKGTRLKIRGYSVDVAEVEAALQGLPRVQTAAVIADEDGQRGRAAELVAFVIPQPDHPRDAPALRQSLLTTLPPYMIPGRILFVDTLPFTATGKVDRLRLAGLAAHAEERPADDSLPRDETEAAVAEIFADLLSRSSVGRGTDFFLAGGDSLKAVELHLRLERLAGRGLELSSLLRDPTVAGVAGAIRVDSPATEHPLAALRTGGSQRPIFFVHGRLGQALVSPRFLRIMGEEQPVYGFRARGITGSCPPHRTVPDMAATYIEAMREVQPDGPYRIGGLCAGSVVALEMARQLNQGGVATTPLLLIGPSLIQPKLRTLRWYFRRYACLLSLRLPRLWRLPGTVTAETVDKIHEHAAKGKIKIDLAKVRLLKAGIRVTIRFELALDRYGYPPYPGPVLIITSSDRPFETTGQTHGTWREFLAGDVRVFDVGRHHDEMFDVQNEAFAAAVRICRDLMVC